VNLDQQFSQIICTQTAVVPNLWLCCDQTVIQKWQIPRGKLEGFFQVMEIL